MAGNSVGSIVIDAKLQSQEVKMGSRELQAAVKSLTTSVQRTGRMLNSAATGFGTAMRKSIQASREITVSMRAIEAEATTLKSKLDDLGKAKIATPEYKKLVQDIKRTETAIDDAIRKQELLRQAGVSVNDNQFVALNRIIDRLSLKYDVLREKRDKMLAADEGTAYVKGENTAEYKNAQAVYDGLRQRYAELEELKNQAFKPPYLQQWEQMPRLTSMIGEGFGRVENAAAGAAHAIAHPFQSLDRVFGAVATGAARAVGSLANMAGDATKKLAKMAGNAALSFLRRLASEARNAAIQLARLSANAVSSGLKKIGSAAVWAAKSMFGFNRQTNRSNGGLKTSLKTILKYAFGVRSMFFLFRRLRTAVKDAFKELAKQNPEVKTSISALSKALAGLKGSLATAFAPILTVITPALTRLINMLTAAMNTIGAFMAALSGASTVSVSVGGVGGAAKNVSNSIGEIGVASNDSAQSVEKIGDAGEEMAKDVKKAVKDAKRQLLGFDELNVLNDNGGGGGGGGGGGMSFQTVPIESRIKEFTDRLRALWSEGAYEEIGNEIAKGINKALDHAKTLISWDSVKLQIEEDIKAVAGIINGLFDPEKGVDFDALGKTAGEGVKTLINTLNTLKQYLNVYNIGAAIGTAISGFLSNIQMFKNLGELITGWITAKLDLAQGIADKIREDWAAEDILATIEGLGWEDIADKTWTFIKTVFGKSGNFLNVLFGGESRVGIPDNPQIRELASGGGLTSEYVKANYPRADYTGVWDEVAENFTKKFNQFVSDASEYIEGLEPTDVIDAMQNWISKFGSGINWNGLGTLLGEGMRLGLKAIGQAVANFRNQAPGLGQNLARFMKSMFNTALKGENSPGKIFSDAIKGVFDLAKAILEEFDPEEAASSIIDELGKVDWDGIAKSAWDAFKLAVSKLGNFLTVIFGGEVKVDPSQFDESHNSAEDMRKEQRAMRESTDGALSDLPGIIGNAVSTMLSKLDEWINKIPWTDWGAKINEVFSALPWGEWGDKLASALKSLFTGIDDLISSAIYGEDFRNNAIWQTLHPQKLAQYEREEYFASKPERKEQYERTNISNVEWLTDRQKLALAIDAESVKGMSSLIQEQAAEAISTALVQAAALYAEGNSSEAANILQDLRTLQPQVFEPGSLWNPERITGIEDIAAFLLDGHLSKEWQEANNQALIDAALQLQQGGEYSNDEIVDALGNNSEQVEMLREALGMNDAWNRFEANKNPNPEIYEVGNESYYAGTGQSSAEIIEAAADGVVSALEEDAQALKKNTDKKEPKKAGIEAPRSPFSQAGEEVDATKKQTKETRKLAKQLKKNAQKQAKATVGIDFSGSGLDLEGDQPTVKAGVKFVPDGQGDDEEEPKGLLDWLQTLLDPGVTVEQKVSLVRDGFDSVLDWLDENGFIGDAVKKLVELARDGKWADVLDWLDKNGFIGDAAKQLVQLARDGNWGGVIDWMKDNGYFGPNVNQLVDLVKNGDWTGVIDWLKTNKLFGPKLEQLVDLIKNGDWTGVIDWLKTNKLFGPVVQQAVEFIKNGDWTGLIDWLSKNKLIGPVVQQAVEFIRNGNWSGLIDWLTQNKYIGPIVQQLVEFAKSSGLTTVIEWLKNSGLLGPAAQQFIDLVMGNKDSEAEKVLNAGDKKVTTTQNLSKGDGFSGIVLKALKAVNDKMTTGVNVKQGSGYTGNTKKALEAKNDSMRTSVNVGQGKGYSGDTKKALEAKDDRMTTSVNIKKGWSGTWSNFLGLSNLSTTVRVFLEKAGSVWGTVKSYLAGLGIYLASGGIISNSGAVRRFSSGGAIMNSGRASWWNGVQKYAAGTSKAHGTVFVAGESGPEIMGHVNGKTEILNKSQLAEAIYGAVVSGMAQAVNALGSYLANHMSTCTNAVISTISSGFAMMNQLNYYAPNMASGAVMPYDVSAQIAKSTTELRDTMNENNEDLIQAMVSAIGNAASAIITAVQSQKGGTTNNSMTSRQILDMVNRTTNMYGTLQLRGF